MRPEKSLPPMALGVGKRAGVLNSQGWRETYIIFTRTWVGVRGGRGMLWRISRDPFSEPWAIAVLVVGMVSIGEEVGRSCSWNISGGRGKVSR